MENPQPSPSQPHNYAAAAILFCGTAAVVLWQNAHLGILWDLSYILETAQRIAAGDIPYRDFPLPFAPLTFLAQAALIKLTGRVFFHHVIYAATAGGLATLLTWRILLNHLHNKIPAARLCAFLLAAPLLFLGIYSVFPHPFYDPDCTLTILLAIFLLQRSERHGFPPLLAFCAGASVVIPIFVKQNAGLAFAAATAFALMALLAIALYRRKPARGILWILAGAASALALAVALIHFTAGLGNYWHWTMQFAASRRLPALPTMLAIYNDPRAVSVTIVGAALLLRAHGKNSSRWFSLLSVAAISVPFVWSVIALFVRDNSSDRVEQLLALWPFLLYFSFFTASWNVSRRIALDIDFDLAIPFILIATVNGAFLSQQVWGSTYALWPLFVLLVAWAFFPLLLVDARCARLIVPFIAVVSISLTTAGAYYALSHERLDYAKIDEGAMAHATLPELAGLSVRGPWIPQFEQLVDFARQEIPPGDGVLMIPGEDLFYFTTGRRPQFPVIMFDHTLNPYSPEEILEMARSRGIRWLIVKNQLQVNGEPVEQKQELLQLLAQDFRPVKTLGIYTIYRREPNASQ